MHSKMIFILSLSLFLRFYSKAQLVLISVFIWPLIPLFLWHFITNMWSWAELLCYFAADNDELRMMESVWCRVHQLQPISKLARSLIWHNMNVLRGSLWSFLWSLHVWLVAIVTLLLLSLCHVELPCKSIHAPWPLVTFHHFVPVFYWGLHKISANLRIRVRKKIFFLFQHCSALICQHAALSLVTDSQSGLGLDFDEAILAR